MKNYEVSIRQFGAHAILMEWPARVEEAILEDILGFVRFIWENGLEVSKWELVPIYNTLTLISKEEEELDFQVERERLSAWYASRKGRGLKDRNLWRLPVCYDEEFGIDLIEVSQYLGRTVEDIVKIHTSAVYTVYGIGFLPGFMYLGGVPEELEVPRKSMPRGLVQKGSVGLAGKQTGIYPQNSPGGWNLIGSCSVPLFDLKQDPPFFIKVGDKVQFYPISKAEYQLHQIESEVGIYKIEKTALDG